MHIKAGRLLTLAAAVALAATTLVTAPAAASTEGITAADIDPSAGVFTTVPDSELEALGAGDGTPAGAVQWFRNRMGSTAYQGLCEKAVENAYGVTGVWASANAHWFGASPKHTNGSRPPKGAFVYWNISKWGHVGIADGNGGIYATSIGGKIGHASSVNYFRNYRGWTPAAVPRR
ncbi:CHAP domain-containing protein [Amycolatopsis suaedae]|uniref:CHAP domain-containing protein n=1 Tax=Amycolatopsis suaedae TaxID=2510978 RepID=A0A4Q7J3I7_9PSEU|nr:CHAP domain-containing protein [Amycolatopsis suaedae]RZQ60883.1 CHAP domain-containing protein [Amycolatopsis suaedae]